MNCKACSDSMMGYFDGTLNDIELAQMKQHLKVCKSCGNDFEAYGKIINFLGEDDGVEPPINFEACVMEKISTLEVERKKKTDRLLIFIYSVSTVILAGLAMLFLAGMRHISLFGLIGDIGESFSSFSNAVATLHSVARITYNLITGLAGTFFEAAFLIIKAYYYVFLVLLAMFLVVQKMFIGLVRQDNGGTK